MQYDTTAKQFIFIVELTSKYKQSYISSARIKNVVLCCILALCSTVNTLNYLLMFQTFSKLELFSLEQRFLDMQYKKRTPNNRYDFFVPQRLREGKVTEDNILTKGVSLY